VGTVRREYLDRLLILGRRHLELVLAEYLVHYNEHRPHRGVDQQAPGTLGLVPDPIDELQPGDLLFFAEPGGKGLVHHVAIYVGGGRVIDSPYTGASVEIVPMTSLPVWDEFAGAIRVTPGERTRLTFCSRAFVSFERGRQERPGSASPPGLSDLKLTQRVLGAPGDSFLHGLAVSGTRVSRLELHRALRSGRVRTRMHTGQGGLTVVGLDGPDRGEHRPWETDTG
jgi:hypothetical protein